MYVKPEWELQHVCPVDVGGRAPRVVVRESGVMEEGLGLPLQGVRESFFNISIPHLPHRDVKTDLNAPDVRGQESEASLPMDSGELRDVKDII